MSRSQWKGNFIDKSLYKNFSKKKTDAVYLKTDQKSSKKKDQIRGPKIIKINSRRSTILKPFVGKEVWIYNGQAYIKRKITETMVGHKFGEFAYTRKRYIYKKKNAATRGGRR